ncbi:argininosuccinate synthetase [Tulasnella sp. 331]|nr:argininosuccinate synthetase [Tulasnella sp. 331]
MFVPLFLGLDLSTQQLKASIIDAHENLIQECAVHFDTDLVHHGTHNGAIKGDRQGEMTCPVMVWLESIDLLMKRLQDSGVEFGRVLAVSGAAQQHGSVYWKKSGCEALGALDPKKTIAEQLGNAFSLPRAPLWQDSSTTSECRTLEESVGGAQTLADRSGSRAYERFTASQIKRIHDAETSAYDDTARISLISSFVASLFLGKIAPIERSDASGMNLMDLNSGNWDEELLKLCGGDALRSKLGEEPASGGTDLGRVSKWWVDRFGFNEDCIVAPFTGDNPSSIVSLSSPGDAILSLGTSTTLLVSIPPSNEPPICTTSSHILGHPTTPGGHIAMLCYKNGDLARKEVRDKHYGGSWEKFDESILNSPAGNNGFLGFFFPMREIIPDGVIGEYHFKNGKQVGSIHLLADSTSPYSYSRAICETQLLSIKARLSHILPHGSEPLRRCIVTGGASANTTILHLVADVLNLPTYIAATSASATIGGALLAQFAWWKKKNEGTFEEMRAEVETKAHLTKVLDPRPEESKVFDSLLSQYEKCEDEVVQLDRDCLIVVKTTSESDDITLVSLDRTKKRESEDSADRVTCIPSLQDLPPHPSPSYTKPSYHEMTTGKGRVLLAYSGGLDTSCILAWLIEQGYEVYTFMADVGQEEDFEAARVKALKVGAKKFFLEDLKREFITELIYPAVQANCIYEGVYLLGTSLARPVIARGMIEVAAREECQFVSHGCTGKGNDQVRFELAFYGLKPDIKVIAPWRLPEFYNRFAGRAALLEYAAQQSIPVAQTAAKPWSTDENLFHISYEAGILEDPNTTPPADMWKLTKAPEDAPETPERLTIEFKGGLPIKVVFEGANGSTHIDGVDIFLALNAAARRHGVGRIDIVENRFIGVKSRGCYESPGATILRVAHMDIEGLTLDRNVRLMRDSFVTVQLSQILYNGYFFSPEREFVTSCIPASQRTVNGTVRLKLYKGNVVVEGRVSEEGLYDPRESSMDELGGFEPTDTSGFIQIESIRIKKWGHANVRKGQGGVTPKDVYGTRT